jgi:hypothetical protein
MMPTVSFAVKLDRPRNPSLRLTVLMPIYAIILSTAAAANIRINYLGKGSHWDIYAAAEILWVLCSVLIVPACTSLKRLVLAIIALQFLDSFVDLCAMGNPCWWASPRILIEWKWNALADAHVLQKYIYLYWACTWAIQVPLRCFAIAWVASGGWGRKFLLISLGLNIIWFTAPQDVLFYFVWCGLYDSHYSYFDYLPPEGFWNLSRMILFRVPIGVSIGALLIRAGYHQIKSLLTAVLIWIACLAIIAYALLFIFLLLGRFVSG